MDRPTVRKTAPSGFTLVEMLVVIVIISILVGLTAAALGPARRAARNAAIVAEITKFEMALDTYKTEHNALPPTFVDVNIFTERGDAALEPFQIDARNAVVRHLREMFPKYTPGRVRGGNNPEGRPDNTPFEKFANDVYYAYKHPTTGDPTVDPLLFDPASALVFWLGGLPEQVPDRTALLDGSAQWIPAGFHADPEMPFKPGTPRTDPLFDFVPERIVFLEQHLMLPWDSASNPVDRYLRYYPDHVDAPYVYFKSRRRGANWQYGSEPVDIGGGTIRYVPFSYYHARTDITDEIGNNICVAYRDSQNPPFWRNHDSYQIIAAGLDGLFGSVAPTASGEDHLADPSGLYRITKTAGNFSDFDYDNLANFSGGKLGDEIE